MVFSSSVFMFLFLPLVLAVYFALPWRSAKNVALLVFSLVFYAWGEPVYVFLMVASILMNWGMGLAISRSQSSKKALLVVDVVFNLLILGFFKYESFLAGNINALFGVQIIPDLQLALPIGISFFTLQALSYVIDVFKGECGAQKNVLYLGMYIAMFPQLVAGPIVRYSQIEDEVDNRQITLEGFAHGLRLFIVGLGKKVLLANVCGTLADSLLAQQASDIGFIGCLSAVIAYTFQIYFDFSGYSDMAQGLGRMLGFSFPKNFNYPYISKSATEFWRRWHMSLGSFFRDYLYIPLGGNRVSKLRWMLNIMIVWGVTGLWHGAAWNFVLWGLYYGVLLMCEKLFLLKALEKIPAVLQHAYCVVVFVFGWMLFSVTGDLGNLGHWAMALVGVFGLTGSSTLWQLFSWEYVSVIPIMIVACLPVLPWLRKRIEVWAEGGDAKCIVAAPAKVDALIPPCQIQVDQGVGASKMRVVNALNVLVDVSLLAILVLSCFSIVSSSYNPFIYFQF